MLLDISKKLVRLKVVYYGPAQSGKTTNLERLANMEGLNIMKIDTHGEKTLVFDFVTKKVDMGSIEVSFALYTIPGQDIYRDIRLTVMRGVDGIVFVADAQRERLEENIEFFKLLKEDLKKVGKSYENLPLVLQYNKMDLPNALEFETLEKELNLEGITSVPAIAIKGEGVLETFNLLTSKMLSKIRQMVG
ncbi:MAG: ADP-ribosylation factor-like protein [Hydrogenobacter sp.]